MKSSLLLVSLAVVAAQWGAAPKASAGGLDFGNLLDNTVINPATDVWEASLGLANDVLGYLAAAPQGLANVFVYAVGLLRALPTFGKSLYDGEQAAFNAASSFCVGTAASVFILYAALAALNLLLVTLCATKDNFKEWLTLPGVIRIPFVGFEIPIPAPFTKVLDLVQEHLLDPLIAWEVSAFVLPLEGHSGTPSVASIASATSAAMSAAMILSCTPAVLALIQGGADKGQAEAIAWTIGTALGIQWLGKKAQ